MKMTFVVLGILMLCMITSGLSAQKYFTKSGTIHFVSDAPMEKIEAVNNKASSVIDMNSGKIQWAVLIKAFNFEKALMEEHFNENYMESSTYPKAKFMGEIRDFEALDLSKDGTKEIIVDGKLEIHGVSKDVSQSATIEVSGGKITAKSSILVLLSDYNIEIPNVVAENLSETVEITVDADYEKLNK